VIDIVRELAADSYFLPEKYARASVQWNPEGARGARADH
jgi:hypothetical protein